MTQRVAQYIHRPVSEYCRTILRNYARSIGLNRTLVDDLHVTLVYTKAEMKMPSLDTSKLFLASRFQVDVWETPNGDVAVLRLLDKEPLQKRVDFFKRLGAKSDFPTYEAYISLSYDLPVGWKESVSPEMLIGYRTFSFDGEVYEDIYEEWKPNKEGDHVE